MKEGRKDRGVKRREKLLKRRSQKRRYEVVKGWKKARKAVMKEIWVNK
jgi:hypothetical protein